MNSTILDCLFHHIPVELYMVHSLKKKDMELPSEISEVASAATRAITTGSLLCFVESLWPVEEVKIASLAGAIFGLMLRLLPAYVRGWFSDLRDRSTSSAIESFTRAWCSPPLIANELSQVCVFDTDVLLCRKWHSTDFQVNLFILVGSIYLDMIESDCLTSLNKQLLLYYKGPP